jgi:hypothetical protein
MISDKKCLCLYVDRRAGFSPQWGTRFPPTHSPTLENLHTVQNDPR